MTWIQLCQLSIISRHAELHTYGKRYYSKALLQEQSGVDRKLLILILDINLTGSHCVFVSQDNTLTAQQSTKLAPQENGKIFINKTL